MKNKETINNSIFNHNILYEQVCSTEEDVSVFSTTYSVAYSYKAGIEPLSARIRLTCVYSFDNTGMVVHAGVIEKWTNTSWGLIEEYHDDRFSFSSPVKFRDRLLDHTKSFLLGVPLAQIDTDYENATDVEASDENHEAETEDQPNENIISFAEKTKK